MSRTNLVITLLLYITATGAHADWKSLIDKLPDSAKEAVSASDAADAAGLSTAEMTAGLKEALDTATEIAVNELGQEGGFLDNPQMRIPMPEELAWVEKGLRTAGQEKLADDFVTTMNRAAEQAVPVALEQFQGAIDAMTLEDAQGILNGPEDAATQYFRKHSESGLRKQFLPIVSETTASTGVTSAYKDMTKQVSGGLSGLIDTKSVDLDEYVTDKALDGLFTMVAQEEARIREDPVARSTDLLKKVFGSK
jgi:hypothetical protein